MSLSVRQSLQFALGSIEVNQTDPKTNYIGILEHRDDEFQLIAEVEHPFPPSKLMWIPEAHHDSPTIMASSATTLQIWRLEEESGTNAFGYANTLKNVATLTNSKASEFTLPPLTSFDWSTGNPHKLGTASIDTTCTIWNVERQKIETQLIAHDKAVFDIAFGAVDNLFASVGADGSVRLFDQRNLDHSTIIYESSSSTALHRLAWNKVNTNYIATFARDTPGCIVLDIRKPSIALTALVYQDSCINALTWSHQNSNALLCGTNDGDALVWDLKDTAAKSDRCPKLGRENENPVNQGVKEMKDDDSLLISAKTSPASIYDVGEEINQVQWPMVDGGQSDFVAIGTMNHIELLAL